MFGFREKVVDPCGDLFTSLKAWGSWVPISLHSSFRPSSDICCMLATSASSAVACFLSDLAKLTSLPTMDSSRATYNQQSKNSITAVWPDFKPVPKLTYQGRLLTSSWSSTTPSCSCCSFKFISSSDFFLTLATSCPMSDVQTSRKTRLGNK